MTKRTATTSALAIVLGMLLAACDKVPLIAPSGSAITLSANSTTVPTNGTVGLTAFVIESGGTPVQNGTSVRFTTTLGTITPSDAQTTNGVAVATFNAGANSGIATIHAVSGGAGGGSGTTSGGTGTTPAPTATNVVTITVGVAAVKTISVTASPTSVGPNGGSVTVTATALDPSGGSLAGIPVTFSADHGGVDPGVAITDANGQATTTLTTSAETKVTASSGPASATATVTLRAAPAVTIKCTPSVANATCTAVPASDATNSVTVTFEVAKATGSSALREVTINFGDGTSQGLGTLSGGAATIAHTYSGSSNGTTATYSVVVTATDVDNERSTTSTIVNVTPRSALTIDLTSAQSPAGSQVVAFTATVTGGVAQSFAWDFDGDGTVDATTSSGKTTRVYTSTGRKTVIVTVQTTDGRSATAQTDVIVSSVSP
jgi:Big-like domain-containing protein/PKD domain-containing protein